MSKIFEALKIAQDGASEPILSELVSATAENGRSAPEPVVRESTAPHGIPRLPLRISASAPLFPFDGTNQEAAEQYRVLRTKIIQHPSRPTMLVVSSAGPGDGKTVTAVNLAGALALKSDANVLLVDADFRRSGIHAQLGIPSGPGLAGVLSGAVPLDAALIQAAELPNLYVIPAGKSIANPVELLDSSRWPAFTAAARKLFRYVIVDSPPISALADYDLIQAECDGILFVARPDHSNRSYCLKALETIPKNKLIGVVLNCVDSWFGYRPQGSYNYYYTRPEGK